MHLVAPLACIQHAMLILYGSAADSLCAALLQASAAGPCLARLKELNLSAMPPGTPGGLVMPLPLPATIAHATRLEVLSLLACRGGSLRLEERAAVMLGALPAIDLVELPVAAGKEKQRQAEVLECLVRELEAREITVCVIHE